MESAKTSHDLRRQQTFTRTLRAMHVLHRWWQQGHQTWFCPSHKYVTMFVATLASYGVIKLKGPRSMVMGIMAIFAMLYLWTLLRKFARLLEISEDMQRNWLYQHNTSKWLKMYLRSVPAFRIDIGNFYFVKKTTIVSALWTVINNTISLLLL